MQHGSASGNGMRVRRWTRRIAIVLAAAVIVPGPFVVQGAARADVMTVARDTLRTSWDSNESALSPSSVASSSFGTLFSTAVDGQVYAQPLVIGGTVIAATENNVVYGLDGNTGAQKWSRNLGPAWPASTVGCGDLTPNIGVTSTPVYDPATNSVYLLAKINDGGSPQLPHWYVHALDPATGAERPHFPVAIAGAPTNDPTHPFNPLTAMQRPGLLLLNGVIYAGFASHCDYAPFVGYVVGVSTAGVQTTMWATESGSSNAEGGIWQSGGGLLSDGPGQILFATGNGISPQPGPGSAPPSTLAESVVRLQVGPDGNLNAVDFFSPANNLKLDQNDSDLGSGAPVAIPDGYGTAAHPHLLVQVGKDGLVYLLDRDHLGGMAQGPGGTDAVLDEAGPYHGVWGKPAFFGTGGVGYVYYVENNGYLRALRLTPTSNGGMSLAAVGMSAGTFGYTSGSPVVTSSGTDGSSALVWVVYTSGPSGGSAALRAYSALPDATGTLRQVFSAPIGTASKFSSPATDGGRVYVGTRDGRVLGFGSPTTAAVGAGSTDLGTAPVGTSGKGSVTLTATRPVTISSISTAAPFAVGTVALPQTLPAGGSVAVPVTFSPSVTGQISGTLTVTTSDGETDVIDVHGVGTRDGLGASPDALQFDDVPTQTASRMAVDIVNTGTTAVTITGVQPPTNGELTVDPGTLPAVGQVLQPLTSIAVSVTFSATTAGQISDSLTVDSNLGSVTVPISASAIAGAAHLQVPASLDFGDVPVGTSSTRTFEITNTGNIPMTIMKAKAPAGVFSTTTPLAEGLVVPPSDSLFQSVTFTPTAAGQAGTPDTYYLITADDGQGAQEVMLTGNGVDDPIAAYALTIGAGRWGSLLGQATSLEYAVAGGKCQNYTAGIICWSPQTGVHEVHGAIFARYVTLGGPGGPLGLPLTDETTTPDGIGRFNHFSGAAGYSIYWSPATGAHEIQGAIRAKWASMGWEAGPLGYPVTDETATADGIGRYNDFSGAAGYSIYWSPATGPHEIQGAIRGKWASMGGSAGPLGYPVSDETGTPDGIGRFNHFSGAAGYSIYWSPASGVHEIQGAIRAKWASMGWEAGPLGYPVTDEMPTPDGIGRYNHFSGAAGYSIYWSPATGAHEIQGAIRATWASLGWEAGLLGYPVTDEYTVPVGRESDFAHGRLVWNRGTGTITSAE